MMTYKADLAAMIVPVDVKHVDLIPLPPPFKFQIAGHTTKNEICNETNMGST
jgi:hypothetical protein